MPLFSKHWTVTIFLIIMCCFAEVKGAGFDADEVARVIEETFKCYNNPGLAVSVVKDGKVILSRGFGVENIDTEQPVTDDTVFGIASVSKSFAASLLVKLLYENTNLTVDSRVQELLGDRFKLMDEFRTKEGTFADLMGHRMAIPANNRIRYDSNLTRESLLERLALLPSNDQFRVKFTYSNLFYGLVTYLAEVIGDDTWENLLTNQLLEPLGMDHTVLSTTADLRNMPNVAHGYEEVGDELLPVFPEFSRKWGMLAGSGAVMSTANDMAKWMNFHISEGLGANGKRVMAEDHMEEVHKARMLLSLTRSLELREPQFPITTTQNIYAHGFRKGYYRGYERLAHSGSTLGYKALMSLLPKAKVGVFTALTGTDRSYTYRSSLHYFLMDWALGLPKSWLNTTTICSFPEPWRRSSPKRNPPKLDPSRKPDLNITLFEGTYHNKAYGYLHVRYNASLETLVMDYGWGQWQLFYRPLTSSEDLTHRFYGRAMGITAINVNPLYFIQDSKDGEDVIVGMRATAFESKLPPVFTKLGVEDGAPVELGVEDGARDSAMGIGLCSQIFVLVPLLVAHMQCVFQTSD